MTPDQILWMSLGALTAGGITIILAGVAYLLERVLTPREGVESGPAGWELIDMHEQQEAP